MELIFAAAALKHLKAMPRGDAKQVLDALRQVADRHPQRMSFVTEMVGSPSHWRLRKGDWRAIYRMIGDEMTVMAIKTRGEVYR